MAKWQKKLNKKELKHLKETLDTVSLRNFRATREWQIQEGIICWDCRFIAIKLGIEH